MEQKEHKELPRYVSRGKKGKWSSKISKVRQRNKNWSNVRRQQFLMMTGAPFLGWPKLHKQAKSTKIYLACNVNCNTLLFWELNGTQLSFKLHYFNSFGRPIPTVWILAKLIETRSLSSHKYSIQPHSEFPYHYGTWIVRLITMPYFRLSLIHGKASRLPHTPCIVH